jgi:hypothetical protein
MKIVYILYAILLSFAQNAAAGEDSGRRHQSAVTVTLEQAQSGQGEAREAAIRRLLQNVGAYSRRGAAKGIYEDNLKERLAAIDSIWALGELGDPAMMAKLGEFYQDSDDVLKMNILIGMSKLPNAAKAEAFLLGIAADAGESNAVRSVAFEVLEKIGLPASLNGISLSAKDGVNKADLIFTGGIPGTVSGWFSPDMPVGHTGFFAGFVSEGGAIRVRIADCVPDFYVLKGVRNIQSWHNFTHDYKYPYYGNRTTNKRPSAAQRERMAALATALGTQGLTYSDTHLSQKGPVKFDCVGYTEFLYESVGLNPTEDSYETGWGWPLTPWEQFSSMEPAGDR